MRPEPRRVPSRLLRFATGKLDGGFDLRHALGRPADGYGSALTGSFHLVACLTASPLKLTARLIGLPASSLSARLGPLSPPPRLDQLRLGLRDLNARIDQLSTKLGHLDERRLRLNLRNARLRLSLTQPHPQPLKLTARLIGLLIKALREQALTLQPFRPRSLNRNALLIEAREQLAPELLRSNHTRLDLPAQCSDRQASCLRVRLVRTG